MSDSKISALPTKANPTSADILPIVDVSVTDNKKVTIGSLPISTATQTALNSKENSLGFTPVPNTRTVNAKPLSANITLDTSDVEDTTNKRYVTDAQLTVISNTSGTNTGDQNLSSLALKATSISTNSPLSGGGDLSANRTLSIPAATTAVDGYLSATDWNAFNGKQSALGFTPVNKAGDTMTGQLVLPSIKLKNGANELTASFSGSTWDFNTTNWISFSSGDAMSFSSQKQLNFINVLSGTNANFDEFGGITFNGLSGAQIYTDLSGNAAISGVQAKIFSTISGAQFYADAGGGVVARSVGGDCEISESTYNSGLIVGADGSVFLTSAGGMNRIWLDSYGELKFFFGSDAASDFSIFNQSQGMTPFQIYVSGRVDITSANMERISLTSAASIELNAVDYVSVTSPLIPSTDGAYNLGQSYARWDGMYGYHLDAGNILVSGTLGNGFLTLESQNGAVSAPGSGVRVYSDNTNYPVFKDPSNRAFTFSLNSISVNSNIELIVPNTNGTIATQAYVTANSVQTSNVTFSTFVSSLGTFNLSNAYLNSFTGTTATWSLPSNVSGLPGRSYKIKNRGSGNLTINVVGGGSTIYTTAVVSSFVIAAGGSVDIISDGTYWLST